MDITLHQPLCHTLAFLVLLDLCSIHLMWGQISYLDRIFNQPSVLEYNCFAVHTPNIYFVLFIWIILGHCFFCCYVSVIFVLVFAGNITFLLGLILYYWYYELKSKNEEFWNISTFIYTVYIYKTRASDCSVHSFWCFCLHASLIVVDRHLAHVPYTCLSWCCGKK